MISLEEAINIAKETNPNYDAVQEYADAYEFFVDDGEIKIGGGDGGIVVEKKNGNVLRWSQYFMDANRNVIEIGESKHIEDIISK